MSDSVSSPDTEAGRDLMERVHGKGDLPEWAYNDDLAAIRAIEQEARDGGRREAVPLLETLRFWLWNRRDITNPPLSNIDLRIQEIDAWLAGLDASESGHE